VENWQIGSLLVVVAAVTAAVTWWLARATSRSSSTSMDARICGYSIWTWDGNAWQPDPPMLKPGHVAPQTPGPYAGYTVRVIAKR
jgi:hypothetical protein